MKPETRSCSSLKSTDTVFYPIFMTVEATPDSTPVMLHGSSSRPSKTTARSQMRDLVSSSANLSCTLEMMIRTNIILLPREESSQFLIWFWRFARDIVKAWTSESGMRVQQSMLTWKIWASTSNFIVQRLPGTASVAILTTVEPGWTRWVALITPRTEVNLPPQEMVHQSSSSPCNIPFWFGLPNFIKLERLLRME